MIIGQIKELVHNGALIPKPDAKPDFFVKGWGKRRGESALIYNPAMKKEHVTAQQLDVFSSYLK